MYTVRMLWLVLSLLAPLLWAITNLIDDDLILHRLKQPFVIVGITGLFAGIPAAYFLATGAFHVPSWPIIVFGLMTGVVNLAVYYPYFRALQTTNPESAILFWNLAPVLVAVFAFIFLGERLSIVKYVAIGLIILSTIIIESSHVEFKPHGNAKALRWMILASCCTAIQYLMEKKLYEMSGAQVGITLICIGSFVCGMLVFLSRKNRKIISKAFSKNGWLLTLNQSLDVGAAICSNFAISLGAVSLVSALQGAQSLFVVGLAWLAGHLFTKKQFRIAKAAPFGRVVLAVALTMIGLVVIG
ncbi:MAG: DMT family transporter [Patescibacteria group bacterium]